MSQRTENIEPAGRADVEVRELATIDEFDECVRLQREAFGLPDMELSPRRHLIVSRKVGGWTLGAFARGEMVGFVHHLIAARGRDEITGYSHMMAVARAYQNKGIGARLKWAQRARSLAEGRSLINWTWDPMRSRNAHFNINRLGVTVRSYIVNFYGTDYSESSGGRAEKRGIDSDRLFAEWELDSARVRNLAGGHAPETPGDPVRAVEIPADWAALVDSDPAAARQEQLRVRAEFEEAFAAGSVCAGFERAAPRPRYLFYQKSKV